jgi:hypothetical protein
VQKALIKRCSTHSDAGKVEDEPYQDESSYGKHV